MATSICPACGLGTGPGARYCAGCGTRLDGGAHPRRKTVTVLFCDLADSTTLGGRLDPEVLHLVLGRYWEQVSEVVARHGGRVEKFIGDAVVGVFGVPVAREDDALRAVRAGLEVIEGLHALNDELATRHGARLEIRVGVNTGPVVVGDGPAEQPLMLGDTGNVAARLQQAAGAGEVWVTQSTYELVRAHVTASRLGPLTVKGKERPLGAFHVEALAERGSPGAGPVLPMVGRDRHLRAALCAYEAAVEDVSCSLLTVLGPAGIGKSRLVQELVATLEGTASVLQGRCPPYGTGITYWPLVEMLRQQGDADRMLLRQRLGGIEHGDRVADVLAAVLGVPAVTTTGELAWAFRRWLEVCAQGGPVVAVVDDLQWAEPAMLDLLDQVAERSGGAPILLVGMARPELLDLRPDWGGGKARSTSLTLEPLSERDAAQILGHLLGAELDESVVARIVSAAEGIPLFMQELVAMLMDQGGLVLASGRWEVTSDLTRMAVPPSVQALVQARLDQLDPTARDVLEVASVVGATFSVDAVTALLAEQAPGARTMAALVRGQLVRPAPSDLPGDVYEFTHRLVRDEAYAGLPKLRRALLHESVARWLDRSGGAAPVAEVAGFHLEQAARYRAELGEPAPELAAEAAARLLEAARRAVALGDASAAARLLDRGGVLARSGSSRETEIEIQLSQADVAQQAGDNAASARIAATAEQDAASLGLPRLLWRARLHRARLRTWSDPAATNAELQDVVRPAMTALAEADDHVGQARAHMLSADLLNGLGRLRAAAAEAELGLEQARLGEDPTLLANLWWFARFPFDFGDGSVAEEERWLATHEAGCADDPVLGQEYRWARLRWLARAGDTEESLAVSAERAQLAAEQGNRLLQAQVLGFWTSPTQLLAGDLPAALGSLTRSQQILEEAGETGLRSTVVAKQASALARLGRVEEAWDALARARGISAADDVLNLVLLGSTEALLLAVRGDAAASQRAFEPALVVAGGSEFLPDLAELWVDRSTALDALGDHAGALAAAREALACFGRKGLALRIRALRTRVDELEGWHTAARDRTPSSRLRAGRGGQGPGQGS